MAHNRGRMVWLDLQREPGSRSWYVERRAQWAEWYPYAQEPSKNPLYQRFRASSRTTLSLLEASHSNHTCTGPGYGRSSMQHRVAAPPRSTRLGKRGDRNRSCWHRQRGELATPVRGQFRDFSVWNLNPADYDRPATRARERRWQSRVGIRFPRGLPSVRRRSDHRARPAIRCRTVDALAAQDDSSTITDPAYARSRSI